LGLHQELTDGAIIYDQIDRVFMIGLVVRNHRLMMVMFVVVMMLAPVWVVVRVDHAARVAMVFAVPDGVQAVAQHAGAAVGCQQQPRDPTADSCVPVGNDHGDAMIHTLNTNGNRFANELQIDLADGCLCSDRAHRR
jgi:hypothetical protein